MTAGFRIKGRPWEDCGRELVECEEEEEPAEEEKDEGADEDEDDTVEMSEEEAEEMKNFFTMPAPAKKKPKK